MFFWVIFSATSYILEPDTNFYMDQDPINIYVNPIQSTNRLITYSYSTFNLFCQATQQEQFSSFTQNLIGESFEISPISLVLNNNENCHYICRKTYTQEQKEILYFLIDNHYKMKMKADNIPMTVDVGTDDNGFPIYTNGYNIGFRENSMKKHGLIPGYHYLTTHLNITIYLLKDINLGTYTITRFQIVPISHLYQAPCVFEYASALENTTDVVYSYSVNFLVDDNLKNENRFYSHVKYHYHIPLNRDQYLLTSIISMIIIVSGIIYIIKTIFGFHNKLQSESSTLEVISRDIFRGPKNQVTLSIFVSSGLTAFAIISIILLLLSLNFFGPAKYDSIIKVLIILYLLFSPILAFLYTYFYILMGGMNWRRLTVLSLFSQLIFVCVIFGSQHLQSVIYESSGTISFKRFCILFGFLAFSFIIQLITVFLTIIFRLYKRPIESNLIPRKIPFKPIFLFSEAVENIVGFVTYVIISPIFHSILNSFWEKYVLFGVFHFLIFDYLKMLFVSSVITMVFIIIKLKKADYEWWWISFKAPAHTSVIIFLGSVRYWMKNMNTFDQDNAFIFFFNIFIFIFFVGIINGGFGFLLSLFLLRILYKQ
ncbi:hypothetical protein TRFO_09073 [Tritrichomonas foetus]|uniref:Transmembrane 9 superfamily member n=1 Tax=Tritrichomonas foetus TaxID=1144522 RepID=A0A1J4JGC5_9EUKA|nr:hypothetical protein TRFO_09073 [Tritrichomonas foetus]|eukprot:OHS98194.1 hypothetical protein TRFO_09073 [Tritrichomonas foetus]